MFHYIRYILNNVFCFYLKSIEYSYLDDYSYININIILVEEK
jgi:hypothetical protein